MIELDMDTKPIEQLENDLDKFGAKALPWGVKNGLDTMAFKTSDLARRNVNRKFEIRNKFTERSIQFQKTTTLNIDKMVSEAGSVQDYMREQEEGFTRRSTGSEGVPVPTPYAAGQGQAGKRTDPVKRKYRVNRLKVLKRTAQYGDSKQSLVRRVQKAIKSRKRIIFIDRRDRHAMGFALGFYEVVGGEKTKRGWPRGAWLKMVYNLAHPVLTTKATPWLEPSAKLVLSKHDEIYADAIEKQIEKQRLFRDRG